MNGPEIARQLMCYAAVLLLGSPPLLLRRALRGREAAWPSAAPASAIPFPVPGAALVLLGGLIFLSMNFGLVRPAGEAPNTFQIAGPLFLVRAVQLGLLAGFQKFVLDPSGRPVCRRSYYRPAYWTWFFAVPATFAVHALATAFLFDGDVHPLVRDFKRAPLVFACQAILLAPLVEEWFFRGVVLPWQIAQSEERNTADFSAEIVFAIAAVLLALSPKSVDQSPLGRVLLALCGYALMFPAARWNWLRRRTGIENPAAVRAVFANAMLFAAVHASVWPTPIPLFVLSLALGGLAARYRTFWPSFIAHALFNAISTLMLFVG